MQKASLGVKEQQAGGIRGDRPRRRSLQLVCEIE